MGQTEAAPFITGLSPEYHVTSGPLSGKLNSAGRAITGVDLAVLDEDDQPVAIGEVGEICLRGPNVMSGYLGMEETTQATLRNGWLHTGDGGRIDEDGFLFIVDRVKDMIVSARRERLFHRSGKRHLQTPRRRSMCGDRHTQ